MDFVNNTHRYATNNTNCLATAINKLLCIRVDYKEIKRLDACYPSIPQRCIMPSVSWLIKGQALDVMINGDEVNGRSDTHSYETRKGHIVQNNNQLKSTLTERFCCGCTVTNEEDVYEPADLSKKSSEIGGSPFAELMEIFAKISSRDKIGHFTFIFDSSLDEQNGHGSFRNMVSKPLQNANFNVSLLEIKTLGEGPTDVTPVLEHIQFEHLVIMSNEPLMLTPKILNCGLLFLDVPIVNPEELEKFSGFALLIGRAMENNFFLDPVIAQIKKYKENIPSNLEFFAISEQREWVTDELIECLKVHSFQKDDSFSKPTALCRETVIRLDRDDQAAILIRGRKTVVFARNGWRKWQGLLEALWFRF